MRQKLLDYQSLGRKGNRNKTIKIQKNNRKRNLNCGF